MRGERAEHTWQPTVLVNELYLALVRTNALHDGGNSDDEEQAVFLRLAGHIMKHLLIDHARPLYRRAAKVELKEAPAFDDSDAESLQFVEHTLSRLAAVDPKLRTVIELRVFEGLTGDEIAGRLDCFSPHGGQLLGIRQELAGKRACAKGQGGCFQPLNRGRAIENTCRPWRWGHNSASAGLRGRRRVPSQPESEKWSAFDAQVLGTVGDLESHPSKPRQMDMVSLIDNVSKHPVPALKDLEPGTAAAQECNPALHEARGSQQPYRSHVLVFGAGHYSKDCQNIAGLAGDCVAGRRIGASRHQHVDWIFLPEQSSQFSQIGCAQPWSESLAVVGRGRAYVVSTCHIVGCWFHPNFSLRRRSTLTGAGERTRLCRYRFSFWASEAQPARIRRGALR
jgi:hypothetical protein